jgi:hypothetical protein
MLIFSHFSGDKMEFLADYMNNEYAKHLHNRANNKSQGDGGPVAPSALAAAESHVAASTSASGAGNGSGEEFSVSFNCFVEWADRQGLIKLHTDFTFLSRPPDGYGDEHEAWFDMLSNLWFKATYPNRFGLAWGRDISATPRAYLTRLVLQNRYFGDDIQLVALVNIGQRLRVLTSQPHIFGEAAPYGEIQAWFQNLGFVRICANDCIAWYIKSDNLLISDAHEGNVIKTPDGTLVPIDLNITQPSGELLAWACERTTPTG